MEHFEEQPTRLGRLEPVEDSIVPSTRTSGEAIPCKLACIRPARLAVPIIGIGIRLSRVWVVPGPVRLGSAMNLLVSLPAGASPLLQKL